jgi:hypothetical protein
MKASLTKKKICLFLGTTDQWSENDRAKPLPAVNQAKESSFLWAGNRYNIVNTISSIIPGITNI